MEGQIFVCAVHENHNKVLKIAHLNAELLKCRQHFFQTRELALENEFDILSISDTWFNSSVTNANVEISGYRIFRLDRIGKTGADVCAYVKSVLKVEVLKDLMGITESRLHHCGFKCKTRSFARYWFVLFIDLMKLESRVLRMN